MKKEKNNHTVLLVLFLTMWMGAAAQDFRSDYAKMQERYATMAKFSCEVQVSMYENEKDAKPEQVLLSAVKKMDGNYWYMFGKTKMIVNEKCILYLDEESKEMTYTIRDKKNEAVPPVQNAAAMIDTLLKKNDSVVFAGIEGMLKHYIVYSSKGLILKTDLFLNKETYTLTKLIYHYDKKKYASEKVEINYLKIDLAPVFAPDEFSEKKYAVYSNGRLKPQGIYAAYQTNIIDQNDFK